MTEVPWLEVAILISALGAAWVGLRRDSDVAWRHCVVLAALAFVATVGGAAAWVGQTREAVPAPWTTQLGAGEDLLAVDALNAPMLPVVALVCLATIMTTVRAKLPRFSLALALANNAVLIAALGSREAWAIAGLLAAQTAIPLYEMRARGRGAALYAVHMALFVALLIAGTRLLTQSGDEVSWWGVTMLAAAVAVRMGVAPFHTWVASLFENASFGGSLLFLAPMPAVCLALRFVVPVASIEALDLLGVLAAATAVYAAGLALVQTEARRFFAHLFLSHASLVLVGMQIATPIGLTGAMCMWISVTLALTGFGLTLRAVEARRGRMSLRHYHGLYELSPLLAGFFLLTGLASVGFPGTIGFVATELVVDGAVDDSPLVGTAVVLAAALNSIAVLKVYFRCFTGTRSTSAVSMLCRPRERWAIIFLAALVLAGGLYPRPYVTSRYAAALSIVRARGAATTNASGQEVAQGLGER